MPGQSFGPRLAGQAFDALALVHPRLAQSLFAGLARALALRLRLADRELTALEEA